ncbi:hypothetical protein O181_003450 [Austropuccinia psidii MF-1]|uniref:Uncharacterized protein n=1 Tax=Austropuccinia psidii MF-1 TaxID=1389203 RepID=A0A9Q3GDX5_9BASI|nr:hypothetical protein [Austropuccinia psidii MF-1]
MWSNPTDSSVTPFEIKNLEKPTTPKFVIWKRRIISSLGMRNLKGILDNKERIRKTDPLKINKSELVYYFMIGYLDDKNYAKFVSEDKKNPGMLWKNIEDYYSYSSAESTASNFGKLFRIKLTSSS